MYYIYNKIVLFFKEKYIMNDFHYYIFLYTIKCSWRAESLFWHTCLLTPEKSWKLLWEIWIHTVACSASHWVNRFVERTRII